MPDPSPDQIPDYRAPAIVSLGSVDEVTATGDFDNQSSLAVTTTV